MEEKPSVTNRSTRSNMMVMTKWNDIVQDQWWNDIFRKNVLTSMKYFLSGSTHDIDLHLESLDVKTTFLHGELKKEIYMLQLEGFVEKGNENLVCRLNKSLQGLK